MKDDHAGGQEREGERVRPLSGEPPQARDQETFWFPRAAWECLPRRSASPDLDRGFAHRAEAQRPGGASRRGAWERGKCPDDPTLGCSRLSSAARLTQGQPEAHVTELVHGRAGIAVRRPAVLARAFPGTAADHPLEDRPLGAGRIVRG